MTLREFYELISTVDNISVFHYESDLQEYPYMVYQEFATTYVIASNKALTEKTNVEVIHFSKDEFDETFAQLKQILLDNSIFFTVATTFDRETKVIQNQLEVQLIHEIGDVVG